MQGTGTGKSIQGYNIFARIHQDGKMECTIPEALKGLLTGKVTILAKSVANERSYHWICGYIDALEEVGLLSKEEGQFHRKEAVYFLNHPGEAKSPPPVL